MKVNDVSALLKESGIKPSYQRIKIFEYLIGTKEHPTVDIIYRELIDEIPTLSKTTVYNTLDIFVKHRIAKVITIDGNETRYDADVTDHGHFKCVRCGSVSDFNVDLEELTFKDLADHEIQFRHLYFVGICDKCNKVSH